jgi:hypothetical protein
VIQLLLVRTKESNSHASKLREVAELRAGFLWMVRQLAIYKSFLPQSTVAHDKDTEGAQPNLS